MPNCVVKGCNNASSKHKKRDGITFHTFPERDQTIKQKWIALIRQSRKELSWQPTSRSVVCSAHFKIESFYYTNKGLRRVLKNGYPKFQTAAASDLSVLDLKQSSTTCAVQNDMENYVKYKLVGGRLKLKKHVVPHKFDCETRPETPKRSVIAKSKTKRRTGSRKAIQNEPDTEMTSKTSDESFNHVEPTSDASFEEEALETFYTKVMEFSSNDSSEEEPSNPDEEAINSLALKVTLARIRANPQLYIGIPKNCYHLIDIIQKETDIPTTHILLCLKKIKLDTHFEELADQFGITANEASDIFTSSVPVLANILHSFVDSKDLQIPLRSEYNTCVIDSLEINVLPSSRNSRKLTQTERGNTVKYVVCCTPDGYITYVSPGYGGRQSDERLLEDTKYLDRLKSGDSVIPYGLRNVDTMLLQKGLNVVKPRVREKDDASLRANSTINDSQPSEDQIKRLLQRIREFTMVRDRSALSCELVRVLDESMVISCALINLQSFVIN